MCPQGYGRNWTMPTVPFDREAEAIRRAIQTKSETTKEKLLRLQVFKTAERPAEAVDAKLLELRQQGVIVSEFVKNPKGGRGKEVFRFPQAVGGGTLINTGDFEGFTSTTSESVADTARLSG